MFLTLSVWIPGAKISTAWPARELHVVGGEDSKIFSLEAVKFNGNNDV